MTDNEKFLFEAMTKAKEEIESLTAQVRATTTALYIVSKGEDIVFHDDDLVKSPKALLVRYWVDVKNSSHHIEFEKAEG